MGITCVLMLFISVAVTVYFNESTYSVHESDGLVQPVLILEGLLSIDITVQVYFSINGSATLYSSGNGDNTDYKPENLVVTFKKGTRVSPLNIAIVNDTFLEPDESLIAIINSSGLPSYVNVGTQDNTTVIILNDDCKHKVYVCSYRNFSKHICTYQCSR